eukprot:SAG22_NODE_986_length_6154_cov_49.030884_5_plen_270_part_00
METRLLTRRALSQQILCPRQIARVLPGAADQFELGLLPAPAEGEPAAMQLGTSPSGKVQLLGTGGVELAAAFNWYLNDYLNATYDWNTYAEGQLPAELTAAVVPELKAAGSEAGAAAAVAVAVAATAKAMPLPRPESSPVRPRAVPYSYYMNVCTYGYSLAFVPWEYWVKHIDWMVRPCCCAPLRLPWSVVAAPVIDRPLLTSLRGCRAAARSIQAMQGVNMPLAFVGQEWVWSEVFKGYGLSLADQYDFYSGPAFLPWFRMGNMKGFG